MLLRDAAIADHVRINAEQRELLQGLSQRKADELRHAHLCARLRCDFKKLQRDLRVRENCCAGRRHLRENEIALAVPFRFETEFIKHFFSDATLAIGEIGQNEIARFHNRLARVRSEGFSELRRMFRLRLRNENALRDVLERGRGDHAAPIRGARIFQHHKHEMARLLRGKETDERSDIIAALIAARAHERLACGAGFARDAQAFDLRVRGRALIDHAFEK